MLQKEIKPAEKYEIQEAGASDFVREAAVAAAELVKKAENLSQDILEPVMVCDVCGQPRSECNIGPYHMEHR